MEKEITVHAIKERRLLELLKERELVLATAESCTGGLVAKRITDVPGSSSAFAGGVVTYSNEMKMKLLGVKEETLDSHGAVSHETAYEMARGLSDLTGADVCVSVTGIAGPDGGSDEKPVGLVYVGISIDKKARTYKLLLGEYGSREKIRTATSEFVLGKLIELLESDNGVE